MKKKELLVTLEQLADDIELAKYRLEHSAEALGKLENLYDRVSFELSSKQTKKVAE